MHDDGTRSRTALRDLFAERRVHVRSGHKSQYVVLSPALQIAVAAGGLAVLVLLAVASYNAISGRLAVVDQQRALAELTAEKAQAQDTAEQLAALRQRNEEAVGEIARLTTALAQARDDSAATARIEALQAALDTATADKEALAAQFEQSRAASRAQVTERSSEADALRAEVTGLRAEIDRLEREARSLRRPAAPAAPLEAPAASDAASSLPISIGPDPAQEVQQLQQDLAGAQATVDALSADLDAAKNPRPGAGPSRPAAIAAADLAGLKAQLSAASRRIAQLGTSLAPSSGAAAASDVAAGPALPLPPPPAPR